MWIILKWLNDFPVIEYSSSIKSEAEEMFGYLNDRIEPKNIRYTLQEVIKPS